MTDFVSTRYGLHGGDFRMSPPTETSVRPPILGQRNGILASSPTKTLRPHRLVLLRTLF